MVRNGLITRRTNEADRRQSLLEITGEGVRLLVEDVRGQRETLARAMMDALTPTERELLRLAAGLMDRLAEAAETRASGSGKPEQEKDSTESDS